MHACRTLKRSVGRTRGRLGRPAAALALAVAGACQAGAPPPPSGPPRAAAAKTPVPSSTTPSTSTSVPTSTTSTTTKPADDWQPVVPGLAQLVTPTGVIMRIDPGSLDVVLVPGTAEPGGAFPEGGMVPADRRGALVAATNGGFKRVDARGGELVDGRTVGSLAPGAASLVIRRDGTVDIGSWGDTVGPGPGATADPVAVLQNLALLVDHGRPAADLGTDIIQRWGVSFRPALPVAVWRSGAGVDNRGRLLYAAGANIVPAQLAELLIAAGAVRGMQLDINHLYVFAALFAHPDPQRPDQVASRLVLPGMGPVPGHVLEPGARDFLAVFERPASPRQAR